LLPSQEEENSGNSNGNGRYATDNATRDGACI
jgi:hypothetical protein